MHVIQQKKTAGKENKQNAADIVNIDQSSHWNMLLLKPVEISHHKLFKLSSMWYEYGAQGV